ncbi:MAG: tyrosine-protein phosphatase, partial [Clostridiales bacterium]|nr:tyrosine-protein phosphatase [Clostridiales bacterium]
ASGGVFEHYMTHAMDTLENKYGCIRGYLTEELGLTEPDMEQLRERYTV